MIDLIDQKAYASFTVPSDKPSRYKPWLDQLLFVHAVDDIATRRSVEESRVIGAAIRRAAILHRRRMRAAKHLHRVKSLARKIRTWRALRDYERSICVLDVDIDSLRVKCGTARVRAELPNRSWTTTFVDSVWRVSQATYRKELATIERRNLLRCHLDRVERICRSHQLARAQHHFIMRQRVIDVPVSWFATPGPVPRDLIARLSLPRPVPTFEDHMAKMAATAARRESALRVVRTRGHQTIVHARAVCAEIRRARRKEADRLTYLGARKRQAPKRALVARLTRSYWRGSIFSRCAMASLRRPFMLDQKTRFAREQCRLVANVQRQRLLIRQKTFILDITDMFKGPVRAAPKIQRRLESYYPPVRPALALRMYHANTRRKNALFRKVWAARRHWAHVRVVSTRYRAARLRARHIGGVVWSIANPPPTRSRLGLEARLKQRHDRELSGSMEVRLSLAAVNHAIILHQKTRRIQDRLRRGRARVEAYRALDAAERVRMADRQRLQNDFVTSCRNVYLRNRSIVAGIETNKACAAQHRKAAQFMANQRRMNQKAAIRRKLADVQRAESAKQARARLQAHDLHCRRVRLRKSLKLRDESERAGLKVAEEELNKPLLPLIGI